jgi:hypothetical protein
MSDIPRARLLAAYLEPIVGSVYFAPECHERYAALGFNPSAAKAGGVALPDGPAYFTSRGSCLGQVPGELVASAFAVFNPKAVVPSVAYGWTVTDAKTIATARTEGAVAQLERILGAEPDGLDRATAILKRATEPLRPEGRPLYSGLLSLGLPGTPMGDFWRLGDYLREFRGDSHTAAWVALGLDATEIGLLTELFIGLPMRSYIRTRAWSDDDLDAAVERLQERGLVDEDGTGFTGEGRRLREDIELSTDLSMAPTIAAIGDDSDDLFGLLVRWGEKVRAEGGYLSSGAADLARASERDPGV